MLKLLAMLIVFALCSDWIECINQRQQHAFWNPLRRFGFSDKKLSNAFKMHQKVQDEPGKQERHAMKNCPIEYEEAKRQKILEQHILITLIHGIFFTIYNYLTKLNFFYL